MEIRKTTIKTTDLPPTSKRLPRVFSSHDFDIISFHVPRNLKFWLAYTKNKQRSNQQFH